MGKNKVQTLTCFIRKFYSFQFIDRDFMCYDKFRST